MKKNLARFFHALRLLNSKKLILIMKLWTILSFVCVFQLYAASSFSQKSTVHIQKNLLTLQELISEIEKQTDYLFIFSKDDVDLNRQVNISVRSQEVTTLLAKVFEKSDIDYTLNNTYISLRKRGVEEIANPQQGKKRVTGQIMDTQGEPIIGANVIEKGTTNGTITDMDGKFLLNVSPNATLVVSYIGYTTAEVVVGNQTDLAVLIEEDTEKLDEVVVVGYGTARKGDLTGAISTLKGEKLTTRSTQQLSTALQGQVSGVQVTRSSGEPGASATVRVRGVTTLSNNDPLVIVDGVPSSLNDVIASDVETMTVLKDAASASIYGSRAAAGVILITTKRAKDQQFSFDYNYEFAIDKPTARPKNGDVIDWMNIQNEVKWNDGSSDPYSQYSQETINSWLSNNATDPYHYPNTDWVDLLLKNTTSHEQHSFSVSGGTDKLRTKSTFNYQKGDGYYDNKSYERLAGRVNNDYKITDWLRANIDLDFSKSNVINPAELNVVYWAYLVSPYYTPKWEDGRYADVKDGANPLAGLEQGGVNKTNYYKFGGKAQIDLTPLKGLTLTAIFAPRFAFTKGKKFSRAVPVYYENGSTTYMQSHKTTNLYETRNDNNSLTYQFSSMATTRKLLEIIHSMRWWDKKGMLTVGKTRGPHVRISCWTLILI
jgi:TonB-linked SusC/RagA family outer membrane protein